MNTRLAGFAAFVLCVGAMSSEANSEDAAGALTIWLPGKAWAVTLSAPGFEVRRNEIQTDGRRYLLAENAKLRAAVSVSLQPSKTVLKAGDCRQFLQTHEKDGTELPRKKVRVREAGDAQILEYTISDVDGIPKNERNLFACWTQEDSFVELHVSKTFFKAEDQALFERIVQSVQFVSKEASTEPLPAGSSVDLFQEGTRYFRSQQYGDALPAYQQALEIEKVVPVLDKNRWRALVSNLGVCYAATGDLSRAKELSEYGVSKDPEYPMFYFNLARTSARKGDEADAKSFLQLAYRYRKNLIQGETLPDPRVDDSFQRLLLEKEFRHWVDALYGIAH